jgi:alpha-glucosidase (family GH31 glycosyl hydrolase)
MSLSHFQQSLDPEADPTAMVHAPQVRLTVLTSRLLRLEYSPTSSFEDRPSQPFWYRRQSVPAFEHSLEAGQLSLDTGHLELRYTVSPLGFTPATLSIRVKATGVTWHFGDHLWKADNLGGTTRTLDRVDGDTQLEPGLMARNGWAVVDDSRSLVFDGQGWLVERAAPDNLDLYFFGYGHDYVACLQDFQRVAGSTPLIPRWALGNWWSRYWAYSQAELQALIREFQQRDIPLSVCIIDMDWHLTDTGNASVGWTGYTWNQELIPDPSGLIAWLHEQGLKTALNLHPADGVFPHEAQYPAMARAVGIDPDSGVPVPFDIADRRFAEAYFTHLHHPHEADGVDFWWLDWQQGTLSKQKNLDPLWWLNHLHFYDLGRDGQRRPFIFSRWGGLGNHRYPIGFSGDTVTSWDSLAFQPAFTATAANVGYGWWSHDIGGHMWGIEEGELYLRWVQYGVFSPIFRLHSSNNPYSERRPWGWSQRVEAVARAAMQLRHALIPYLYAMTWRNHRAGLPLITPLYYSHPDVDEAYQSPQAYWFGSELVAAPFTAPHLPDVGLSRQRLWLPPGLWFDFVDGRRYQGGWLEVYGDWEDIPVFARPGAIVPLGPRASWGGVDNPTTLELHLFAGADNRFSLYEDDGETTAYQQGHHAQTDFSLQWTGQQLTVTIAPVHGDLSVVPGERRYPLYLRGIAEPDQIELMQNGRATTPEAVQYDPNRATLRLDPPPLAPTDSLVLTVSTVETSLLAASDRRAKDVRRLLRHFRADVRVKAQVEADLPHLMAGQLTLDRYDLTPAQARALEQALDRHTDG